MHSINGRHKKCVKKFSQKASKNTIFEVAKAGNVRNAALCIMTPCSLVAGYHIALMLPVAVMKAKPCILAKPCELPSRLQHSVVAHELTILSEGNLLLGVLFLESG